MTWVNRNGLIVPSHAALAKALSGQQDTDKGKFFSNYTAFSGYSALGMEKPHNTLPFDMLRKLRYESLIDVIIIMARITQMQHIAKRCVVPGKQTGFRVVHQNYADPNFKPEDDVLRRCKEMERIIDSPNPKIHPNGFVDFAAVAADQELAYDRKAMVIAKDRTGSPIRYHLVDGPSVRPVQEYIASLMAEHKFKDPGQAYAWAHKKSNGSVDLTGKAFVQVVEGVPVASWREDEMSVNISMPSVEIDRWAYGAGSKLEQSAAATQTWLYAWSYNDGLFNQDSPESLLFLYGDVDPIGLGAFQRQVLDQSGSGDYQKVPVIQSDPGFKAELVKIRELPKDIQFAEFMRMIIQLKTAAYRAHPSIVNFSIDKGGQGGLNIGNQSEDYVIKQSHEEGFQSIVHGLAAWLTKVIVKPRYDDLVVIFDVDVEDEGRRIEVLNKELNDGAITFNEWRRSRGVKGDLEYGDIPGNKVYADYALSKENAGMAVASPAEKSPKPTDDETTESDGDGKDGHGKIANPDKVPDNLKKNNMRARTLVFEIVD